jgi:group I intron endonuclease
MVFYTQVGWNIGDFMSKRLKEFLYYVYKIGIIGSDKYYIGRRKCKTDDPMTDGYFGSGNWVKYIKDKTRLFKVVLAVFDNISDCKAEEQRLLDIHRGLPDNMNISAFADGGSEGGQYTGWNHTEETKQKISEANSGENNGMYGKTGELCHNFGKTASEETKAKMSAAKIGTTFTEETKRKLSDAKIGRCPSKETKAKQSAAKSGEKCYLAKLTDTKVILIRELWATGNYTQKELASKFGVGQQAISNLINLKRWKHI